MLVCCQYSQAFSSSRNLQNQELGDSAAGGEATCEGMDGKVMGFWMGPLVTEEVQGRFVEGHKIVFGVKVGEL